MFELYDIKLGKEIGKGNTTYGRQNFIYSPCSICLKPRWVRFINGKPERERCRACFYLSMKGSNNPHYKDGKRHFPNNGYIEIRIDEKDFFFPMADKNRDVYEHRLVMAQSLNRCLLPWEIVHHKNGIRNDNRLENLELITDDKYHLIDKVIKKYIHKLERENKKLRALHYP